MRHDILGPVVKKWRERKSVTQQELAEDIGLSTHQYISNVECGRSALSPIYMARICKRLRIPLGYLLKYHIKDVTKHYKDIMVAEVGTTYYGAGSLDSRIKMVDEEKSKV